MKIPIPIPEFSARYKLDPVLKMLKDMMEKEKLSGERLMDAVAKIAALDDNIRYPSKTGGCFVKGTPVQTRQGLRPIDEVQVGDYVLSSPEDGTGEPAYKRVLRTMVHERKTIRQVIADWGEVGRVEMIAPTGNHPFWVEGVGWTRADLLNRDSVLRIADGRAGGVMRQYPVYRTAEPGVGWTQSMADVETSHGNRYDYQNAEGRPMGGFDDIVSKAVLHGDDPFLAVTVYNIEVEDYHTYYVGKTGFWVHNANCEGIVPFYEGNYEPPADTPLFSATELNHYLSTLTDAQKKGIVVLPSSRAGLKTPFRGEELLAATEMRKLMSVACSLRTARPAPQAQGDGRPARVRRDLPEQGKGHQPRRQRLQAVRGRRAE